MATMQPGAGAARIRPARRGTRFTDTLAAEWTKLTSVRSTYITLALGLALSLGATALVSTAVGTTYSGWGPADQAQFEPIMFSMFGNIFGLIVFAAFGVLAVSGEHSSGMMRLTLTATPRRGRVLAAKALVVGALTLVVGVASTVGMFLMGQAIFDAYGMETASLADIDTQRAVLGLGLALPYFAIVGLALGFVLRSTAGAITAVLGLIWLPVIFGNVLPMWWRENVLSLLPCVALDSVTISHLVDSPTYREPASAAVVAVAWLVAFVAAAYLALRRRDA